MSTSPLVWDFSLFNKYLLSTCCVPGTNPGRAMLTMAMTDKVFVVLSSMRTTEASDGEDEVSGVMERHGGVTQGGQGRDF
jgi:hypothetical protein